MANARKPKQWVSHINSPECRFSTNSLSLSCLFRCGVQRVNELIALSRARIGASKSSSAEISFSTRPTACYPTTSSLSSARYLFLHSALSLERLSENLVFLFLLKLYFVFFTGVFITKSMISLKSGDCTSFIIWLLHLSLSWINSGDWESFGCLDFLAPSTRFSEHIGLGSEWITSSLYGMLVTANGIGLSLVFLL